MTTIDMQTMCQTLATTHGISTRFVTESAEDFLAQLQDIDGPHDPEALAPATAKFIEHCVLSARVEGLDPMWDAVASAWSATVGHPAPSLAWDTLAAAITAGWHGGLSIIDLDRITDHGAEISDKIPAA